MKIRVIIILVKMKEHHMALQMNENKGKSIGLDVVNLSLVISFIFQPWTPSQYDQQSEQVCTLLVSL